MGLAAGRLNKRVTIEQATESQDSFGEPDKTWATYATRWCSIEYDAGREFFGAESTRTERRALIRLHYDTVAAAITAKMRGTLDSTVFEFLSVATVGERRREIQIQAVVRG